MKVVAALNSPLQFVTATMKLKNPKRQIAEHMANGARSLASVNAMRIALKLPTAKLHSPSTKLFLSVVVFVLSQMPLLQDASLISHLTRRHANALVTQRT